MSLDLEVQYASTATGLPSEVELRRWAEAALPESTYAEALVRIVDVTESATLNQTYRRQAGPTNVLSFPFAAPPGTESAHLGDVVICAPVVESQARAQGKTLAAHWAHMVVHGVLHLQGYDHQHEREAAIMETLETRLIAQLGYSNPYA